MADVLDPDRKKLEDSVLQERNRRKAKTIVDREELTKAPSLTFSKVSHIKPVKIEKIFGGRFQRGSFSFIVGQGEVGKGVVSSDIIARLTTGAPFPGENGARREPIKVMMCATEDSQEQIRGRLEAAEIGRAHV